MPTEDSINRKAFLMKMGFTGAALMAALSSCVYEKATLPSPIVPVILIPAKPSVSANTFTNTPISITTETDGTILVYKNDIFIESITVNAGLNTYLPISTGNYTFILQTVNGVSLKSDVVAVAANTNNTPILTVTVSSVIANNPIVINSNLAGTILVFNGKAQVATFQAVKGDNIFTPLTAGVYTFKLQTEKTTSAASASVTVTLKTDAKDLLTLDLTQSANSELKNIGGYIRQNDIVVALIAVNTFAAVTQVCSHEGRKQVILQNGEFYCTAHGARFTTAGVGINGAARSGLTVYKTNLEGDILHVFA